MMSAFVLSFHIRIMRVTSYSGTSSWICHVGLFDPFTQAVVAHSLAQHRNIGKNGFGSFEQTEIMLRLPGIDLNAWYFFRLYLISMFLL